ncbi:MAG: DUF2490 domain-containing protein [Bacteroidia bacterium]|nr:DUF2490 domain-containing protein [Bacteroidia bacterium]
MKRNNFLIFFFFPLLFLGQYNDAGLWLNANVEKKLLKDLSVSFNPTVRFNENVTELGQWFLDQGLSYKLNKRLRVSVNYRYSQKRKLDDTYANRHRFYADLTYKMKLGKIALSYRLRGQDQYAEIYSREKGRTPSMAIRNKLQAKYASDTKFEPFLSAELWYGITNKISQFNNVRVVGGTDYELNKYSSITLSYIFQKEFAVKNPETDFIFSLGYNYSF